MSGWIRIERDLMLKGHPVFDPEPMSQREAWTWMIARAAWHPTTHMVNGREYVVQRGSFFGTLRNLTMRFRWTSLKRLRTFVGKLESEGMLETRAVAGKTLFTIVNYDLYQSRGPDQSTTPKPAPPKEETGQGDLTDREKLLMAMGIAPTDMSPSGKIPGDRADMHEASRWRDDLKLSLSEQIDVIADVTSRRQGAAPTSFRYFTRPMQEAAARKQAGPLKPATQTGQPLPGKSQKVRASAKEAMQ